MLTTVVSLFLARIPLICKIQKVQQFMEGKQLLLNTEKTEIVLFDENSVSNIDFLNTKVEVKHTAKFLCIHQWCEKHSKYNKFQNSHFAINIISILFHHKDFYFSSVCFLHYAYFCHFCMVFTWVIHWLFCH